MDKIPEYAILNESVNIANKDYKKLINAILRNVIKQGFIDSDNLSIKYSMPDFIVKMFKAHYKDNYIEILNSYLSESKVYGRINTLLSNKSDLIKDKKFKFLDDICFLYEGNIVDTQYFKEGRVIVQDYSSQQVCKYLDLKEDIKVLDCCSAPGTKTSQISMYMNNTGEVYAVDIHKHRVKLIEDLSEKLNIKNIKTFVMDACETNLKFKDEKFDRILIDAPCSGLGVLRRKPDIKFRITPEDIDDICKIQSDILNSCKSCINDNGIIVYSTCTLNKKENERQVEKFLSENKEFSLLEYLTIFPYEYESDGFFIAKLIKNGM